ncbi:unnamed protein product [Hapterophycus canaliculatus]
MRSLHHPWTLGLATGKTSRSSFKKYVAQDAYFLRAFAKAYAYALIKADDEKGVRAFHALIGSVLDELGLHASYSVKWGVDVKNELRGAFPNWSESVYAEWIETYSSADFENAAVLVESLLDEYSQGADYASLLALYRQAMELEFAFFDAQTEGSIGDDGPRLETDERSGARKSSNVRSGEENVRDHGHYRGVHQRVSLLCVDFDDTLTDGDTTSLLVETAIAQQRQSAEDKAAVQREWESLTSAFLREWGEVTEECLATKLKGDVCTAKSAEAVDRSGLEDMLRRLEAVDLDSVSRVSGSKVMDIITQVLSETVLMDHRKHNNTVRLFIFSQYSLTAGESILSRFEEDRPVSVFSNDLVYDEHGVSTGEIEVKVSGSFGKHQRFLSLAARARKTASTSSETSSPGKAMTMYVGDSVTDLLAMLDADVGIVVGTSGTFDKVASAFGIAIYPLASAYQVFDDTGDSPSIGASRGPGQCVYRASQWVEIDVFLFGID